MNEKVKELEAKLAKLNEDYGNKQRELNAMAGELLKTQGALEEVRKMATEEKK